jgi:hypothetical protein
MKLSEHVVDFEKQSAIKSQVLVDFIIDWTEPSSYMEGTVIETPWQVHCDGAWGSPSQSGNDIDVTIRHQVTIHSLTTVHNRDRKVHQQYSRV